MKTCIKNKQKGLTLIELIVALVILVILAAIFVPTFIKYIDKSKQGEYIVTARSAMDAAQCIIIEEYAKGTSFDSWRGFSNITDKNTAITNKIYELSEIDKTKFNIANVDVNADGQLIFFNLYSKKTINGKPNRVVYMNGTIGGKKYDGEFIISCWNGVEYYPYKSLDPAQVGYKKN